MLLDALVRADRNDALRAWLVELLADPAFLTDKASLRRTLETLRAQLDDAAR